VFFRTEKYNKALQLFNEMKQNGVQPDFYTSGILISGLLRNNNIEAALKIYNELKGVVSPGVHTWLITALIGSKRQSQIDTGISFFSEIKGTVENNNLHNAVLNCYIGLKKYDEAESLFQEMKDKGPDPNVVTFNTMIKLTELGKLNRLLQLLGEMKRLNIEGDAVTTNSIMTSLISHEKYDNAISFFEEMSEKRDLISYNLVMKANFRLGNIKRALYYMSAMKNSGFEPDPYTYHIVITELLKLDEVEKARKFLEEMTTKGFQPGHDILSHFEKKIESHDTSKEQRVLSLLLKLPIN